MASQTLAAEHRKTVGTRACRALRGKARIPGIIYGHKEAPEAISLDRHDIIMELQHGHRLLSIRIGSAESTLLIRDVQYDHLGIDPVHIDLQRVDLNETIQVEVEIELLGTPRGAADGGVLDHPVTSTQVECLASNIPDKLTVVINDLDIGGTITLADLELPKGVTLVDDPETMVAALRVIEEEEADTAEAADDTAEASGPEVISRGKDDEEDKD